MAAAANQKILVLHVDDDQDFADLTSRALERDDERFAVETVASVDEALERIADRPPDCVVSEYDLPLTDGVEFLEAVRDQHPELPFILYTGEGSEAVASESISAGVTDYVRKENETEQHLPLATCIENAVTEYRSRRLSEQQNGRLELFFQESPLGAVQWDADFRVERLNERAEEILGSTETALRGESWETVVAEDDWDSAGDTAAKFRSAEGGRQTVHRNGDGERRTIEWHNRVVTDADGDVQSAFSKLQDVTDREKRKSELEEYETVTEALTDAIYVLDEEGRFTYVSDEFVELVGYDRETVLGDTPSLIKDEEAIERAETQLGRLLSSDGPDTVTFEVTVQPRDGDPIVCEDHMGVLPYEGDRFDGSVGILRDITDRKERKQRVRDERNRFRSVFDDAFDAMVIADDDGEYIDANDRAAELFGLPVEELVGKSTEAFTPDGFDVETAWRELREAEHERDTFPLVRPDGTERLVEYAASTDIVPGQHLSVLRDVTERRRRERRFQALVEESNDVISIVDAEGRYQYQSPSIERILGHDPVETLGDSVWEYIHPDDRAATREQFEAWVDNPDTALDGIEYRARHADGSWRWMEAHGNDQIDNPTVEGYVVNSRDITHRKERQQQLDRLNRVLRHNLRNDLNVIRAEAEAIRASSPETTASSAEKIIQKSDQVVQTTEKEREITELLQELSTPEAVTVGPLLRQAASSIRTEYPDATVTVDCPDGVTIQATEQFERAVRELLTNAIVHNDSESPEVAVTVDRTDEMVCIEIADNGPRIPEMERNILLGSKERTPLNHGSGLGLWLVQLLVSRSGGAILFEQNSPAGNVVVLELPG